MEESTVSFRHLTATSKQIAQGLLTIGENRLELLAVEIQEERERFLRALLLALSVAAFGLLAGVVFTAAIVVWAWPYSHLGVLFGLAAVYGAVGLGLYLRLTELLRNWQMLAASLDQLRKDRRCLEKILA